VAFVDCLEQMGCEVHHEANAIAVVGRPLHGIDVDMNAISDTVQTLSVVALFAEGPTTIRNVGHIRHKETDRLAALSTELRRLGADVVERADGLTITPKALRRATIETYHDHRMAMSFALAGLRFAGVQISNPSCASKTYPAFFADLARATQRR
jgi:3-phosphoshikimate 1-carboxyvinyltransferase